MVNNMNSRQKWLLLSRLRRVVRKVKILLNLDLTRWRLASLMGSSSSRTLSLSFSDRPGLRSFTRIDRADSGSPVALRRSISRQISEDDIDKRAEMFIQNFRNQLQIERQISLDLKYLSSPRPNSFKSLSPGTR